MPLRALALCAGAVLAGLGACSVYGNNLVDGPGSSGAGASSVSGLGGSTATLATTGMAGGAPGVTLSSGGGGGHGGAAATTTTSGMGGMGGTAATGGRGGMASSTGGLGGMSSTTTSTTGTTSATTTGTTTSSTTAATTTSTTAATTSTTGTGQGGMGSTSTGQGGSPQCVSPAGCPGQDTECSKRTCTGGVCGTMLDPAGTSCNAGGIVCNGAGSCVACVTAANCPAGQTCLPSFVCSTCSDGVKDGNETGVDCGGPVCPACGLGQTCSVPGDCALGNCLNGSCACGGTHLLIAEIRSRGLGGGADEFIELYNPTASAVMLDSTWVVDARSTASSNFTSRWAGAGQMLGSDHYLLLAGSAYAQAPVPDALETGVTDASAVRLTHAGVVIDEVCFAYDAPSTAILTGDPTYGCPGTPANNAPHDNTGSAASDVDLALERKPGEAAGGNCIDTGDNAADFSPIMPSNPQDLAGPAVP